MWGHVEYGWRVWRRKEWVEFHIACLLWVVLCPLPPSQCVKMNCGLLHSINLIFKYDSYHNVLRALWLGFCHAPKISKGLLYFFFKPIYRSFFVFLIFLAKYKLIIFWRCLSATHLTSACEHTRMDTMKDSFLWSEHLCPGIVYLGSGCLWPWMMAA